MTNDLYFISMIADVLGQAEPKATLRAAIEQIQTLGQRPEYDQGLLQFQRFIAEVKRNWERRSQKVEDIALDVVRCLALQVAADLLEGDQKETQVVLDLIGSQPRWQEEFEKMCGETSKSKTAQKIPEIIIGRNGERISSIPCERLPVTKEIRNVKPGLYSLKLNTGRLIWEEELTERELLWAVAFPREALDLAADTWDIAARATRKIVLLNGELIIRVFPEIESGHLELTIGDSNLG
jgi:hypothetical protein